MSTLHVPLKKDKKFDKVGFQVILSFFGSYLKESFQLSSNNL